MIFFVGSGINFGSRADVRAGLPGLREACASWFGAMSMPDG